MKKYYYILIACLLLFVACKHTKVISTSPTSQKTIINSTNSNADVKALELLAKIKKDELPFQELSAKMKTKITSNTLNQSFTTNIRWKKGEKIWMSMSIIGIEGMRILITKDSIKIMDRLNSRYILKPLSYIKDKALVDLSFQDVEHILLGQPVFIDTTRVKYAENTDNFTLSSNGIQFLTTILLDKNNQNITHLFTQDQNKSQSLEATFSNYQTILGKPFATTRLLTMKNPTETFNITYTFQKIEAQQNLSFPFSINSSYKIEK